MFITADPPCCGIVLSYDDSLTERLVNKDLNLGNSVSLYTVQLRNLWMLILVIDW